MSFNDYVKFVTEQIVMKIDQPREVRKAEKAEKKANQPPLSYRAFGMIPLSIRLLFKKQKQ